jgi:hypothetical protein
MNKLVSGTTAVVALAVGAALALAVPGQANADGLFGAMTYSPSTGTVGWGTGPTRQAAQDAAYDQCSPSADDCTWVAYTQAGIPNDGCLALVKNNQNWAGGNGSTKDAAIQAANQKNGGPPGQVLSAQCVQGS